MTALTVSALDVHSHHGARARVSLNPDREGLLSHARNPSYPRRDVRHWWLIIPSACRHFTSDALSLQWSGSASVTIIEERAS